MLNLMKRWLPVFLIMILIFYLSSRSDPYLYTPNWQVNCEKVLPKVALWQLYCDTEYLGRIAHTGMYFLLSLLLYRAMATGAWKENLNKVNLWTFILGWGYGWSDEIHQLLVPGRTFQLLDLSLDLAGVTAGIVLIFLVIFWKNQKFGRKEP
jgi:VanZ family protein